MKASSNDERRAALRTGPPLVDEDSAVTCCCSCHPRPCSRTFHDGGSACPCQQTPVERKQAWDALLALGAETQATFDAHEREVTGAVAEVAQTFGASGVRIRVLACPLVITGSIDGLSFLFRERHGAFRVAVPPAGDDPTMDLYANAGSAEQVLLAGDCRELAATFEQALAAVQAESRSRGCSHTGARSFCPDCGATIEAA